MTLMNGNALIYRKVRFLKKSKTKTPIWEFNGILPINISNYIVRQ